MISLVLLNLLCLAVTNTQVVSSFGFISLTANTSTITNGGKCLVDSTTLFTCKAQNISQNTLRWYINNDPITYYTLTSTSNTTYPISVVTMVTGVEVAIINAQDNNGSFTFTSTLSLNVASLGPKMIGCGTLKTVNKTKINCIPPMVFKVEPSNEKCVVGNSVTFHCQPLLKGQLNSVLWSVNDNIILTNSSNITIMEKDGESQLTFTGCLEDWDGYGVKCSITTETGRIFSNSSSTLTVQTSTRWQDEAGDFFRIYYVHIILFIVGILLGVILTTITVILLLRCIKHKHKKKDLVDPEDIYSQTSVELPAITESLGSSEHMNRNKREKTRERIEQEEIEQTQAAEASRRHLPSRYKLKEDLPGIGSRLKRYWFRVYDSIEQRDMILTRAPVSMNCKLKLDKDDTRSHVETLNKLLRHMQVPSPFQVYDIFLDPGDDNFIFIIQPMIKQGSLKDLIYDTKSLRGSDGLFVNWSKKYAKGSPLDTDTVALYGRQILRTMMHFYVEGLSPLGHVQTGNIFLEGDVCQLGGYENTLLGYRTHLYRMIAENNCLASIDVIMFGHVIYEMSAGKECPHLVPSEEDYEYVKDESCKDIMQYIFKRKDNGKFKHSIQKISERSFFQDKSAHEMKRLVQLVTGVVKEESKVVVEKKEEEEEEEETTGASGKKRPPWLMTKKKDTSKKLNPLLDPLL